MDDLMCNNEAGRGEPGPPMTPFLQHPLHDNAPIAAILITIFSITSIAVCVIIACCMYIRKPQRNGKQQSIFNDADDTESQTEDSIGDLHRNLRIKEWAPTQAVLCKGKPIRNDNVNDEARSKNSCQEGSPPTTLALFPDFRGFGHNLSPEWSTIYWSDDSSSTYAEDFEDENSVGTGDVVDLVDAGVFKRTLAILKEQPRCVLCSVKFKGRDSVSVGYQCQCEFHQKCIRRWIKANKSGRCPVCKETYTLGLPPS